MIFLSRPSGYNDFFGGLNMKSFIFSVYVRGSVVPVRPEKDDKCPTGII